MQRVIFAEGFPAELRQSLAELGAARVLMITTRSRRFLDRIENALPKHEVFDGALVHVPAAVVSAADLVVRRFRPDTVVTLGGGATTGLAKALRLDHDLRFVAIPTTYSGSERTTIYGITSGADKTTGRDDRVRPEVVIYEPSFTAGMPLKLKVQSLMNALAHPVSALSTGITGEERASALDAVRITAGALRGLIEDDTIDARREAFRAAAAAGDVIQRGSFGAHHRIAHALGGRFGLPHAPLHSVLLPHTVHALGPQLRRAVAEAAESDAFAPLLVDFLEHAKAETSLRALGVDEGAMEDVLAGREDLPVEIVRAAFRGDLPGETS